MAPLEKAWMLEPKITTYADDMLIFISNVRTQYSTEEFKYYVLMFKH